MIRKRYRHKKIMINLYIKCTSILFIKQIYIKKKTWGPKLNLMVSKEKPNPLYLKKPYDNELHKHWPQ